jgi:acetoin utilization protein AcuB
MLVRDWMTSDVVSIEASASISHAIDLMNEKIITMLPVVRQGRLVGVISDMDLKPYASPPGFSIARDKPALLLSRIKVKDIMSKPPITIPADYTVEEAARILSTNRISGLVVVDANNQIVGVISQTDVNKAVVQLTGLWRGGIVFGVVLEDRPGTIKDLDTMLRSHGGRIGSILTSSERAKKGFRKIHFRVRGLDRHNLPQIKKEISKKATLLYVVDSREGTREIFETITE